MTITSAFCTSAKLECLAGGHCFDAPVTPTGDLVNGNFTITTMSTNTGISVGSPISGFGITAGTVVASIDSATQITMSKAATASNTTVPLLITGDTFKVALFKAGVSGTFGAGTTNYSNMGTDEVTGAGYIAGGQTLINVSPVTSGTTSFVTFSANPSWSTSSWSTDGFLIYNASARMGGTSGTNTQGAGRAVGVFAFSSTNTVAGGTFTIILPVPIAASALFRFA